MERLPNDLKEVVGKCIALLGEVVKEEGSEKIFQSVEYIRKNMIEYRKASYNSKYSLLEKSFSYLQKQKQENLEQVTMAYGLMLELTNSCEMAYRRFRLSAHEKNKSERQENAMIYVLTAHPTEARTPQTIEIFRRIQNLIFKILNQSGEEEYLLSIIKHNIKLLWLLPLTRHEKPEVRDEAEHIFSIILRSDIFDTILRTDRDIGRVRIRTWVGGDKDGHPGVDENVMVECFNSSRKHFVRILGEILTKLKNDLDFIDQPRFKRELEKVISFLQELNELKKDDYRNILKLKKLLQRFSDKYIEVVGSLNPRIRKINAILEMFPALVVPIEIREDSEIVRTAIKDHDLAIYRMLKKLREISTKDSITFYAQGFVLSMCHSVEDIQGGIKLVTKTLASKALPVVPLFETAKALTASTEIVKELLGDKTILNLIQSHWENKFEIMLGYSDSSKGMGVLASRLQIAKAMRGLDIVISDAGIKPIFFHGSGGSVDRGGGSIQDQTAWWPENALTNYKATIQGEMVERTFSSPEVMMSGVDKVLVNLNKVQSKKGEIKLYNSVLNFSELVKNEYVKKIEDPEFFELIEKATPYSYLKVLKIGSRPTKRSKNKKLDLNSIRAIPWILCWTQTRVLFPTWWGIGTAWKITRKNEKDVEQLKKAFNNSPIFSSYVRSLAFTLSKMELPVFELYLKKSGLKASVVAQIMKEFKAEYTLATNFVRSMSGQKSLMWYRPWLEESILLRSSMINPLNIVQILAAKRNDHRLLRSSVAGISSGMMTTG
ncbi:phosphoenolpyruvate carboxylase [Bacteriovorax sp. DB6_IX]|uniref:phosphoenolpyruvate carboxylase n=1 Tax=Bacteriovorax sp. DB6_IX TaxID=1353530 RepID=UPI00038A19A1|nr:phosphoenolpyruvate carboxylase [Bacteriovorax sp. DB6_IX]EQC51700.1 phosphoenolpyruvate carboxylase-like protein [Bacteriovorax sp. DB6_IX]